MQMKKIFEYSFWNPTGKDWVGTQRLIDEIKADPQVVFKPVGTLKTYIPTIRRFLNHQRKNPNKIKQNML